MGRYFERRGYDGDTLRRIPAAMKSLNSLVKMYFALCGIAAIAMLSAFIYVYFSERYPQPLFMLIWLGLTVAAPVVALQSVAWTMKGFAGGKGKP
jgi:hypothetical protein